MIARAIFLILLTISISSGAISQEVSQREGEAARSSPARDCFQSVRSGMPTEKTRDKRERMRAMAACLKSKHEAAAAGLSTTQVQP